MAKPLRILIVEDSEDDALLVIREVERGGYDTTFERVETAEAMTSALEKQAWDIIIADYRLPHFSAPESLKLFHQSGLDLPFIVISGTIGEETAVEMMKAGAHDYLMKDNLTRLVPAIERELREAEVRKERKRVEEELRVKDTAITSSIAAIAIADLEGNLTYVNHAFLRMWGHDDEKEILGKNAVEFWQVAGEAVEVMQAAMDRGGWIGELAAKRKDGSIFDVLLSASVVRDEAGKPICRFGSFVDITERKQAEEALIESEEKYRALVELGDKVGEAIIMRQDTEQGERMHVFVSDEWIRLTGYSEEELLSMSFSELVHPRYREGSLARYRRRMRGENIPEFFEISIIRKDGAEVSIELTSALTNYKGKSANVAFIRDITERKKMEERLMITDRLASVGELAAGIAHELNNPLTSVIGFSDLLLQKDLPGDVREDLQTVNREAKRTAEIIKNLLTFARKHEAENKPTDINKVIENVLALRAYEQKVHNIEVRADLAPDLSEITADGFKLQQVFLNIIINAEHFMTQAHGKGTLTINTKRVGDTVQASFADDGPGIPKESLSHLFDPFFTTKEAGTGTGLGLSICHGITAEHGGRIYAESKVGEGATFIVELPITQ